MTLAAAVVGLGRAGSQYDQGKPDATPRSHVGAILQTPGIDLVAVCDVDQRQRDRCLADWGLNIPAYATLDQLLQARTYDLIVVATPTGVQHGVLGRILSSPPRLIFCEKPFCETYGQSREISKAATDLKVKLVVNYQRRWDEKIRTLTAIFRDMGRPERFEVQYSKGLLNYGSHMLDLLEFFFGPISKVLGVFPTPDQILLADPSLSFMIEFESGLQGYFSGMDCLHYELFDLSVFYRECRFTLVAGGYEIRKFEGKAGVFFPGYEHLVETAGAFPAGPIEGLLNGYQQITGHLSGKSEVRTNVPESAIRVHHVIEEIRNLALSNKVFQ